MRSILVSAPHVKVHQVCRLDDRLAAHMDGLAASGEYGSKLAATALERPGRGEAFSAALRSIENRDVPRRIRMRSARRLRSLACDLSVLGTDRRLGFLPVGA
jgi:hypothetical protein